MEDELLKLKDDLDGLVGMFDQIETPIPLVKEDGTPHYLNIMRVLRSDKYSKWREENDLADLKGSLVSQGITSLLNAGMSLGHLAFGLRQIKSANQVNDQEPRFPEAPRRSLELQMRLAEAQRLANEGLSPAEKAVGEEQDNRDNAKLRQDIINASGGQSGGTQANLQIAAIQRQRQRLAREAQNEGRKTTNRAALDQLLGRQLQETDMIRRHGVQKFQLEQLPLYYQRVQAKDQLLGAGIQNVAGAVGSAGQGISNLAQMINPDLIGRFFPRKNKEIETTADVFGEEETKGNVMPMDGLSTVHNIANNIGINRDGIPEKPFNEQRVQLDPETGMLRVPVGQFNTNPNIGGISNPYGNDIGLGFNQMNEPQFNENLAGTIGLTR